MAFEFFTIHSVFLVVIEIELFMGNNFSNCSVSGQVQLPISMKIECIEKQKKQIN
jgi:hypothetical protein